MSSDSTKIHEKIKALDAIEDAVKRVEELKELEKEKIEVTSAIELDKEILDMIHKKFGEEYEITSKIDKSVIGGIRIKLGSKMYDGTIQAKLDKMRLNLTA